MVVTDLKTGAFGPSFQNYQTHTERKKDRHTDRQTLRAFIIDSFKSYVSISGIFVFFNINNLLDEFLNYWCNVILSIFVFLYICVPKLFLIPVYNISTLSIFVFSLNMY